MKLRSGIALIVLIGALLASPRADADTIQAVYLCGPTVEILLRESQVWLFADTTDGATTEKMVDRIYAMALATWASGTRSVTFYYPNTTPVTSLPCIAGPTTAYRIGVLQVQ